MSLIDPKNITIVDGEGKEKIYLISKFPAVQGREIIAKYPISNMPKLGEYAISEETMLKLMAFVAVELRNNENGNVVIQPLNSRALIDNHVKDWEALAKLEMAMIEYNCSFFRNGRISASLNDFALITMPKIIKTWITSLAQSSPAEKQP